MLSIELCDVIFGNVPLLVGLVPKFLPLPKCFSCSLKTSAVSFININNINIKNACVNVIQGVKEKVFLQTPLLFFCVIYVTIFYHSVRISEEKDINWKKEINKLFNRK